MRRWALLAMTVLALTSFACGQASSPVERQEQQEGVEQAQEEKPENVRPSGAEDAETTAQKVVGNMPVAGAVGENVETPQFDYRILDVFTTNHYYYLDNPTIDDAMEGYSQAGEFVVVNYSVTNTSPQTLRPKLGALLHAKAGGKTGVYEESRDVMHPKSDLGTLELAPGQMGTGQFIFDVPTDVDPEFVAVLFENDPEDPRGEAGVVDLTRQDPLGLRAEEVLALQYEYLNMTAWKQAYELFAEESKREVSLEQYEAYMESGQRERPTAVIEYAFPSVEIAGDHAIIERVFTLSTPDGKNQLEATQEAVLEDKGWRIVMRDDQIRALLQRGTIVLERTQ
jgi:hypothetical protein